MAKKNNNIVKLFDNSIHTETDKINTYPYAKTCDNLNGKDIRCFLNTLNGYSIKELNENKANEGDIWVWPHSFEDKKELEQMTVLECKFDNNGKIDYLHTGNLVGWIGNGKVQVEISSRFSKNTEKNGEQDYFLYYMLSKVFRMNIVSMEVGGGSLKELDLLVFMFPRLLQEAMRQGLFKQYVKREYNDSNVKGTIDVNRHLRFNNPANGRIAYRTREFSFDNYITQLIRHTIVHIEKRPMGRALLSGSKEIEECVKHIVQSTPTFQKGQLRQVMADNRKIVSHPYFTKYKALQQICLAILRNERVSHGALSDKVHGILIDAAWLWEEYLAIVLEDVGFKHHTSKDAFKLFENHDGELFQKVIPDYVHTNDYIADAKYIPLDRYEQMDAERAAAVYYKTIMYMYLKATSRGFLFYPYKGDAEESMAHSYQINNGRDCFLHKIGMKIPDADDYGEFCENIKKVELRYNEIIMELTKNPC